MTEVGRPAPPSHEQRIAAEGARLFARHGELMDSRALVALFKFRSDRSFRRSAAQGRLPVSVFRVAGRRGWFARTRDVAEWLAMAGNPSAAHAISTLADAPPSEPSSHLQAARRA